MDSEEEQNDHPKESHIAEPSFEDAQRIASKKSEEIDCSCLIQCGSTLRKEDYTRGSDLDFLAIYNEEKDKRWKHDFDESIDISILNRSKEEFLNRLENGHPFDLMALKFGKIRKDDGFLQDLDPSQYSSTKRTIKVWIRSGLNHYSEMINDLDYPIDFFNAAYHSFRSFSRILILKESNKLVECDRNIKKALQKLDKKAEVHFWTLRKDRLNPTDIPPSECFHLDNPKVKKIFKKVDYIGKKIMAHDGKDFLTYRKLKKILNGQDNERLIVHPKGIDSLHISVFMDGEFKMFEYDMRDGNLSSH
ncbi:MAG: hypothetical protein ACOC5D_02060 [Thermoplasmatota archaeon]